MQITRRYSNHSSTTKALKPLRGTVRACRQPYLPRSGRMSGWGRGRQCAEWFSHALMLAARRPSGSTAAICPPSIWEGVQSRRLLQASGTGQHSTVLQPVLGQTRGFYRSSAALAEALSSQEIPASKADEDDIPSDEVCLTKEGWGVLTCGMRQACTPAHIMYLLATVLASCAASIAQLPTYISM